MFSPEFVDLYRLTNAGIFFASVLGYVVSLLLALLGKEHRMLRSVSLWGLMFGLMLVIAINLSGTACGISGGCSGPIHPVRYLLFILSLETLIVSTLVFFIRLGHRLIWKKSRPLSYCVAVMIISLLMALVLHFFFAATDYRSRSQFMLDPLLAPTITER